VGQTLGEIKLAAVGSTSSLNFFALGFFIGLSAGCSVITSQHFGAGNIKQIKKSVAAHILIGIISSAVLTVAFVFLVNPFLTMLGTTKETFDYASRYLTIIYLGIPATMLYNLTASLLRSVGDSKTPLYLLLFSSVLNVGLDLLFIVVFKWDVAGAAIATVVSQLISAVLCCIYICFKVKLLLPTKESFTSIGRMVADELKVGCPMGLQNSVISIGMMVLQYFVNQFGSYAVAGYTIGNRVQMLVQNPMNSMSMVIATFAGQNEGAGKYDRIRKGVNYCLILCITYAIAVGALTMLFATPITGIFTSNSSQQTIDYSVQFIFWNCPFEFTLGMLFIYRGTIQGLKNGIIPMIGSLIEVLMRICAPVILSSIIGYISICVAGPAAWTASMLLMLAVYYIKMKGFKNKKALA
jgi:putative MATE family efflux protein